MRTGLITAQESDFLYLEAKRIGWRSPQDFSYYLIDKINEIRLYGNHLDLNLAQTSPILSEYLYRVTKDSEGDRDFYHKIIDYHAERVDTFLNWLYEDKHFRQVIQNIIHWKNTVDQFLDWKKSSTEFTEDYYYLTSSKWENGVALDFLTFSQHFVSLFHILRDCPYFYPFNNSGTLRIVNDPDNHRLFLYDSIRDKFITNQQLGEIHKANDVSLSHLKHHFYSLACDPTGTYFPFLNHELIALIFQEDTDTVFDQDDDRLFSTNALKSFYAADSLKNKVSRLVFDLNHKIKEDLFPKYNLLGIEIQLETSLAPIKNIKVAIPNQGCNEELPAITFDSILNLANYIKDNHFSDLSIKYCNIVFDSIKDKTQFAVTQK